MIKGKEGIALILAIVFMLAITILLTAVLLLSTQEINATQLYLDSNKALYYAEAGVEYAQARILKAIEDRVDPDTIKDNIISSVSTLEIFHDSSIKEGPSLSINKVFRGLFTTNYSISCAVRYGKAFRKITKVIQFLDKNLDKAIASQGSIDLQGSSQNSSISIYGNIYAKKKVNITGTSLSGNYTIYENASEGFTFPTIDFDYYRSLAKYYIGKGNAPKGSVVFDSVDQFVDALKSSNPPKDGIVFVEGEFHLHKLNGISLENLCIVVNGDLSHKNKMNNISWGSRNSVVYFIARSLHINNVSRWKLDNAIFYTEELYINEVSNFTIEGGGIYSYGEDKDQGQGQGGGNSALRINNVNSFTVKSISEAQKDKDLGNYFLISWSDASV